MSELVKELLNGYGVDGINKMSSKQYKNLKKFLRYVDDDERIGYFKEIVKDGIQQIDKNTAKAIKNIKDLTTVAFREEFMKIYHISEDELKNSK